MKGLAVGGPGEAIFVDFQQPDLKEGDLLVKPLACGICSTDIKLVKKGNGGRIEYALGHELAAEIIEVTGDDDWLPGQRVVTLPYLSCGTCYYCQENQSTLCPNLFGSYLEPGGLAEFVKIPQKIARRGTFMIPNHVSAEVAALAEPFGCVIKGYKDVGMQKGDSVLIIGDGPMGIIAAAVGSFYNAGVILVAGMTPHRLEVAERHYAHAVVDVTQMDLLSEVYKLTEGRGADVVISAVSSPEALTSAIECVRPGGWINAFAGVSKGISVDIDLNKLHYEQYFLTGSFGLGSDHLSEAMGILGSGKMDPAPIITAEFPFDKAIEGIAYSRDRLGLKAMITFE